MIFFNKIRWSEKSILALEPKFYEDWCKNSHATRRKSQNPQKLTLKLFFSQKSPRILNFWNKFQNPHIKPFFWPDPTYWDINFVVMCLQGHCAYLWIQSGFHPATHSTWSCTPGSTTCDELFHSALAFAPYFLLNPCRVSKMSPWTLFSFSEDRNYYFKMSWYDSTCKFHILTSQSACNRFDSTSTYLSDDIFPHILGEYRLVEFQERDDRCFKSWVLSIEQKKKNINRFDFIFLWFSPFQGRACSPCPLHQMLLGKMS